MNIDDPQPSSTRSEVVAKAQEYVRSGQFALELAPLVAVRSESPRQDSLNDNLKYLEQHVGPLLKDMGFATRLLDNPVQPRLPALFAERIENSERPTILIYGHGDVLWGMEGEWAEGRDPWVLDVADGKMFGRGTADNKGQHFVNLAALRLVLKTRGHLGFNVKVLIETAEETGSLGLAEIATDNRNILDADCLIASDGPRVGANTPTVFLGGRGSVGFSLTCHPRDGAHHSGNWGGLLSNPAIRLTQALATITDPRGRIQIPAWTPDHIPGPVRDALKKIILEKNPGDPDIEDDWGEPSLTGPEQVYGWCNFEILAIIAGRPEAPVNAIPDRSTAVCQLRYVVGVDPVNVIPALRAHLDAGGFQDVQIEEIPDDFYLATRTDPENPWTRFIMSSLSDTLGRAPALQPNFGGSLPNEVFSDIIGMPTIWIPHSYPNCAQHAPDEHMLEKVAEEGMQMISGLFWDLGEAIVDNGVPGHP